MTQIEQIIAMIHDAETVSIKNQFIHYLTNMASQSTLNKKERDILTTLTEHELLLLKTSLEKATTYREKNDLIGYANGLMELTIALYGDPNRAPQSLLGMLAQITPIIRKERYLENELDALLENNTPTVEGVAHLADTLASIQDEYHRGIFWSALMHYTEKTSLPAGDAKNELQSLMARELSRLFSIEKNDEILSTIAFACDAVKCALSDDIIALLYQALGFNCTAISFYAMTSLLTAGRDVPTDVVTALANDLEFACLTHEVLTAHNKAELFPAELANAVYLAKSDLVHWLVYPTELGKKPDEIEYVGNVTVEKIPYYIFKYTSDSENLDDEARGKWLIGWSAAEGNTFSEFELFSEYEAPTLDKTLKNIKKKILY